MAGILHRVWGELKGIDADSHVSHKLSGTSIVLGKACKVENVDITVKHEFISRKHCTITAELFAGHSTIAIFLTDHSLNGTYINNDGNWSNFFFLIFF